MISYDNGDTYLFHNLHPYPKLLYLEKKRGKKKILLDYNFMLCFFPPKKTFLQNHSQLTTHSLKIGHC